MTAEEAKITAIRSVLKKRQAVLRNIMERGTSPDLHYYEGKSDGYQQALDLLAESLESIKVEL